MRNYPYFASNLLFFNALIETSLKYLETLLKLILYLSVHFRYTFMKPFIFFDDRSPIKDGPDADRCHLKIQLTIPVIVDGEKEWKKPRAKTGVYATEKEFEKMQGKRVPIALADKWEKVQAKLRKAEDIAKFKNLSPEKYLRLMDGSGSFEDVCGMFDYYIGECLKENATGEARDGNALALRTAKNFFIRYRGTDYIPYAEITKEWLEDCKAWALADEVNEKGKVVRKGLSPTSFYIYCRALRTILYLAVEFDKITKDEVPFGLEKGKFKIPNTSKKKRKVKLELPLDQLIELKNKILKHESEKPSVNKALNYWRIAFFGNGANMADVLRWKIVQYDRERQLINFERKKTENTEEDNETITVMVGEDLRALIAKEGNRSVDPNEYIFPVLRKGMSSAERKQAVIDFVDFMNKRLKTARKEMGIDIKLTSSSNRYLLSTILDRSGIPKNVIKELLGHNTEEMQSHYSSPYFLELRKQLLSIMRA